VKLLLALPEFVKGEFSFQNPSAFEVVKLLDLKPGLKVWDACAAPGGKTALMAEMDSSLEILASDSSASRLEKMQDLMNRLGLTNIKTEVIDLATIPQISATSPQHSSKFDRILLDVPCSNMGVIARRPESVYRMTPESINEVAELQFKILENASAALAPGGRLVYATCSPDPTETTRVIARFVKAHPEFVKVGEPVLPGLKDSRLDGFFAQALEYKK
jgi:16S rRNA (cytosine967-C5)-methyltransferase